MEFMGWQVGTQTDQPETGRFVAYRYGVKLCAGSLEALLEVIRLHEKDKQDRRDAAKR